MRRGLLIGAGVLAGIVVLLAVYGSTLPSLPAGRTPAPEQTAAGSLVTLLELSGSGTRSTQTFTVGRTWDLVWAYDCADFADGRGNFIVHVLVPNGSPSGNLGINQLGTHAVGVEHHHTGGARYLEVNSECAWHLTVKG